MHLRVSIWMTASNFEENGVLRAFFESEVFIITRVDFMPLHVSSPDPGHSDTIIAGVCERHVYKAHGR